MTDQPNTPDPGKKELHMTEDRLGQLIKSRYPNILPEVLDIYEANYNAVPWERDPIRGGYRLMDRDLKFLNEISAVISAYRDAGNIPANARATIVREQPKTPPQEQPLVMQEPVDAKAEGEPIIATTEHPAGETPEEIQERMIKYAESHRPVTEPTSPRVKAEAGLDRDAPIVPPQPSKAGFANLEATLTGGGRSAKMRVEHNTTIDEALAPLKTEVSGQTNHDVRTKAPNPSKSMEELARRKEELKKARTNDHKKSAQN